MSTQAPEYKAHEQAVIDLQTALLDRGAGEIEGEVAEVDRDVEEVRARSAAFLRDRGSVFRFLKKAHYNSEKAYEKIKRHVGVRLQSNLDHLEVPPLLCVDEELEADSSHPPHPPVAYFLKHNHHSRLVLVIALSQIAPRHTPINGANDAKDANDDDDDAFDEIKESILYIWEVGRRLMQQASEERGWEHCLDFLTIVDAHNASMKNMHYDIVKFFSDIISIHFPNTSKQILIVNSRMWTNALWRMAMPLLPKKIVDRISFAGAAKLAEVLDLDTLPKPNADLGGQGEYKRVSDYAITRVPDTHAAAITRNSSRNTVWYTPRQTPASSYTNVPKLASKIPSFQLAIRRGGGEGSGGRRQSDTIDTQDIANYREQISAWHKDKIGEGIAGVAGLSTYDAAATATTASSGVGTPIATLDRYSCLNPRYGVCLDASEERYILTALAVQDHLQDEQTEWGAHHAVAAAHAGPGGDTAAFGVQATQQAAQGGADGGGRAVAP
ncbi:hypothetical protein E3P99_03825 [Wallemia hederae]|uniref:CRAL-TRIO domain-containing protein n=1 Tax=Wallemia hederae TaxID=1540922 RepID=A0A4T0FDN4_9BASI|nr:hypothetical protein E3P99_03825 [Wallemia hederae]